MSAYSIATRGLAGRKIPQGVLAAMNALLFGSGQQGAWYDPSDLSALFQDAAGTTPVTAMEQPVGLILDKSQGLVLGPELVTGGGFDDPANWTSSTWTVSAGVATYPDTINDFIRPANANLLPLVAGKFYRVRFTLSGVTGSAVCAVANADGSVSYTALTTFTTDGEKQFIIYAATSTTNIRFYGYTSSGGTWNLNDLSIKELPGNHAFQATTTKRGVVSRRVNFCSATEAFDTWSASTATVDPNVAMSPIGTLTADRVNFSASTNSGVSRNLNTIASPLAMSVWARSEAGTRTFRLWSYNATDGVVSSPDFVATTTWQKFTVTIPRTVSTSSWYIYNANSGPTAGTLLIWGASLTLATDAHLPYQWVNTATDYDADPNKFPTYIRLDGVDDAYQTNSIDFTGTDKMTVWAGVQWNNFGDTTGHMVVNHNSTGFNSFSMLAPTITANAISAGIVGSSVSMSRTETGLSEGAYTAVLTQAASLTPASLELRRNSLAVGAPAGSTGGGSFANAPLFIGSQSGGAARFFNGRLYQLIVRGAQSSLSQLEAGELLTKSRMKLP